MSARERKCPSTRYCREQSNVKAELSNHRQRYNGWQETTQYVGNNWWKKMIWNICRITVCQQGTCELLLANCYSPCCTVRIASSNMTLDYRRHSPWVVRNDLKLQHSGSLLHDAFEMTNRLQPPITFRLMSEMTSKYWLLIFHNRVQSEVELQYSVFVP